MLNVVVLAGEVCVQGSGERFQVGREGGSLRVLEVGGVTRRT